MSAPNSNNPYQSTATTGRQNQPPADDGSLTAVDWVLCVVCTLIGCIVGIVRTVQGKKSGPKMIGISIAFAVLWNVIGTLVRLAIGQ